MNRRSFLLGAAGILAAPAIVRASSIMPVKTLAYGDGVALTSMAHPRLAGVWYWDGDPRTKARWIPFAQETA